jgi:hypothetical protein
MKPLEPHERTAAETAEHANKQTNNLQTHNQAAAASAVARPGAGGVAQND